MDGIFEVCYGAQDVGASAGHEKFRFEKYCYCNFKARFLKTSYFRLLEKIS